MTENKTKRNIKNQATADLIEGKTPPSIEESIRIALNSEDARSPMRVTKSGTDNANFDLKLQRKTNFTTGGIYRGQTREAIDRIIEEYFAAKSTQFTTWADSNNLEPFDLG
ncbi:unnamed protein product [Rotaria socialis]|uniref:Uncharacterized protein n=1 Tax=Rotaria socialis TaxID=392032 RepID=A0A820R765_9BILA|nr:unnamed protein product [Rotaria socialis]CAF3542419.1 unnamed protein product [Rotaria socialis]CAF4431256.1 unnamed protein product [Rotaria socialis]CAF4811398.1 unnamed protein product [Rotaria socialis]